MVVVLHVEDHGDASVGLSNAEQHRVSAQRDRSRSTGGTHGETSREDTGCQKHQSPVPPPGGGILLGKQEVQRAQRDEEPPEDVFKSFDGRDCLFGSCIRLDASLRDKEESENGDSELKSHGDEVGANDGWRERRDEACGDKSDSDSGDGSPSES